MLHPATSRSTSHPLTPHRLTNQPTLPRLTPHLLPTLPQHTRITNTPTSQLPANLMSAISMAAANGGITNLNLFFDFFVLNIATILIVFQLCPVWLHHPRGIPGPKEDARRQIRLVRQSHLRGCYGKHQQGIFLLGFTWRPEVHFDLGRRWGRFPAQGWPLASCPRPWIRTPRCPRPYSLQRKGLQDLLSYWYLIEDINYVQYVGYRLICFNKVYVGLNINAEPLLSASLLFHSRLVMRWLHFI